MDRQTIENALMCSFVGELEAFKPGNVSYYADGHDMTAQDFLSSAEVSVPILAQSGAGVGQRVLNSVEATFDKVGCNTNLGMLLLFAPLAIAAESEFNDVNELRLQLGKTLENISDKDTEQVYKAIRLANPGGLGNAEQHDVKQAPDCSLMEAMQYASANDYVALQYCTNYKEVFESGLETIKNFVKLWNSVKWSTVACYMMYLATIRDSHIERKFGSKIADKIKTKSGDITKNINSSENPESYIDDLHELDRELKANNYNPGTCADLTATSLLAYNLLYKNL